LAVGCREVSIADRDQKVESGCDGWKYELAAPARSGRELLAAGLRQGVEANQGSREWTTGSLLDHDSLDGPSLDSGGDSQQDKDAVHVCALHCYDGRSWGNVEPFRGSGYQLSAFADSLPA
jgi:hypothetical protein